MRRATPAIPLAIALLGGTLAPRTTTGPTTSLVAPLPAIVRDSPFAVHFLDVGTGDSAIIDLGDQEIVIDGGDSVKVLDEYAARTGLIDGPIELVIVTHGDTDHWRGLTRLLGFDGKGLNPPVVREFWEPGFDRDCRPLESYSDFIRSVANMPGMADFRRPLQNSHAPAILSRRLEPIHLPGLPQLAITVLSSNRDPTATSTDCAYQINNASIVFLAEIFNHRFLFTGDANGKERNEASPGTPGHVEKMLLDLEVSFPGLLKADVIKVPHHGSETASTQAFIDKVDPDFVVISASTKHHLPKDSTVARYDDGRRTILRTDKDLRNNTDHIVCFEDEMREVDCNWLSVLEES